MPVVFILKELAREGAQCATLLRGPQSAPREALVRTTECSKGALRGPTREPANEVT
jgi:hypothetical protein